MSSGKAEKNLWRCQLQREHFGLPPGLGKGRTEQGQRDGADRGRERDRDRGEFCSSADPVCGRDIESKERFGVGAAVPPKVFPVLWAEWAESELDPVREGRTWTSLWPSPQKAKPCSLLPCRAQGL